MLHRPVFRRLQELQRPCQVKTLPGLTSRTDVMWPWKGGGEHGKKEETIKRSGDVQKGRDL